MSPEERFFILLNTLAKFCRFELDETVIGLYDQSLEPLGYPKVCNAIEILITKRSSRDPFPSVNEIVGLVQSKMPTKFSSFEVANKIITTISKKGHTWNWEGNFRPYETFDKALLAELGEIGFQLVKSLGGWDRVCEESNTANIGVMRAQLRQTAEALLRRQEQEQVNQQIEAPAQNKLLS